MANPAFKSLIEGFNSQIKAMNKNGLKLYEPDNPEWFISGIRYDEEKDKIFYETKEDPAEFKRMTTDIN
jgi:hypothetical protein